MNIANAVADFGRSMGLQDFCLEPQGLVSLELQPGDVLTIEQAGEDLLVYRVLAVPYVAPPLLFNALKACNARLQEGLGWQLQVGLRGTGADTALVFLYRLSGQGVSGRAIEQAIDMIERFRRGWSA